MEEMKGGKAGNRIGEMVAWAGIYSIPAGSLLCDGSEIDRTKYEDLYDVIGAAWGKGDGISTFNLPDGRGGVPKGVGCSKQYSREDTDNQGRDIGKYQSTGIVNITGELLQCLVEPHGGGSGCKKTGAFYDTDDRVFAGQASGGGMSGAGFDASKVVPTGSTNRDNNFGINWIIYYK